MPPETSYPHFVSTRDRVIPGITRKLAVSPNPVGQEWLFTVPGGRLWQLLFGQIDITTDAIGTARIPYVVFDDSDTAENMYRCPLGGTVGLSQNGNFSVATGEAPGSFFNATAGAGVITMPRVWLQQGWSIGSFTQNLDPGDQYTRVRLWVQEIWQDQNDIHFGHHDDTIIVVEPGALPGGP